MLLEYLVFFYVVQVAERMGGGQLVEPSDGLFVGRSNHGKVFYKRRPVVTCPLECYRGRLGEYGWP